MANALDEGVNNVDSTESHVYLLKVFFVLSRCLPHPQTLLHFYFFDSLAETFLLLSFTPTFELSLQHQDMSFSTFKVGLLSSIIVAFLLLAISVNAAPVSLEERGGAGPTFCKKPLKIARYRDVCLGEYNPIQGQAVRVPLQPGLAMKSPSNSLDWLTSAQMGELQESLGSQFSGVHCDQ